MEQINDLGLNTLPQQLNNLLSITGFGNLEALMTLNDADIELIEKFAREDLPNLIDQSEYEEYYGIYKKIPQSFRMLPGHKKTLLAFCAKLKTSQLMQNPKASTRKKGTNVPRNVLANVSLNECGTSNSSSPPSSSNKSTLLHDPLDLHEETKYLKKDILKKLKDMISSLKSSRKADIIKNMQNLQLECKLDRNNEIYCLVSCIFCPSKIKIFKESRKTGYAERWIRGNFYKHFSKHLKAEVAVSSKVNSSEEPKKLPKTILNFYSKVPPRTQDVSEDVLINTDESQNRTVKSVKRNEFVPEQSDGESPVKSAVAKPVQNSIQNDRIIIKQNIIIEGPDTESNKHHNIMSREVSRNNFSKPNCNKSRFLQVPEQQPFITSFFPYINEIEKILRENKELKNIILQNSKDLQILPEQTDSESLPGFLQLLARTATSNKHASKKGNRYEEPLKKFCCYLFTIGGRLLYETLHANLSGALPSIPTLERKYAKDLHLEEGSFRFEELKMYLEEHGLPKIVWVSEDATRINGNVRYCRRTNKNVGFVLPLNSDGLPDNDVFKATSLHEIRRQFEDEVVSTYAYVIMAQPLKDKSAPFCVSVYGTDNKFTAVDVLNRLKTMITLARKSGIEILGLSSDGDSRLLKTMRFVSRLSSHDTHTRWKWFHSAINPEVLCIQDTVHIGTKLRTRLIKPSILLPFGDHIISVSHLTHLILHISKDNHCLVQSDVSGDDKMNFAAVEKICDERVTNLLESEVTGSDGTVLYLKIMKDVLDSYLDKRMSIEKRILILWKTVFLLRIWRQWIINSKEFNLKDNFISLNSYISIELNAHALICAAKRFSTEADFTPEMFVPWLMSSQPCEQTFRSARSMTTTFSTVINFSMLDILNRLHKIQFLQDVKNNLKDEFSFPRENSSRLGKAALDGSSTIFHAVDDNKIEDIVLQAQKEATLIAENMGIRNSSAYCFKIDISSVNLASNTANDCDDNCDIDRDIESDTEVGETFVDDISTDIASEPSSETSDQFGKEPDEELENLWHVIGDEVGGHISLKDYPEKAGCQKSFFINGPLLKILLKNGSTMVVKKTSLCWLFGSKGVKLSNDRLLRVQSKTNKISQNVLRIQKPERRDSVNTGDWCIFKNTFAKAVPFLIGKIYSFRFMQRKGKKAEYASTMALLSNVEQESLGCLCNFYTIDEASNHLVFYKKAIPSFYPVKYYECTIPTPMKNASSNPQLLPLRVSNEVVETLRNLSSKCASKYFKRKRTNESSEESSDDDSSVDSHTSLSDSTSVEDYAQKEDILHETNSEPEIEKYYAVYYDEGWYIGRIIGKINKNIVVVKFLKEEFESFMWPKSEDVQQLEREHIFYGPIAMQGCEPLLLARSDRLIINKKFKELKRAVKTQDE